MDRVSFWVFFICSTDEGRLRPQWWGCRDTTKFSRTRVHGGQLRRQLWDIISRVFFHDVFHRWFQVHLRLVGVHLGLYGCGDWASGGKALSAGVFVWMIVWVIVCVIVPDGSGPPGFGFGPSPRPRAPYRTRSPGSSSRFSHK